jgi:hypothetical protein
MRLLILPSLLTLSASAQSFEVATIKPAPAAAESRKPSIFTAVQEQLGLKLESAKGKVDVIIIDSADHPTEN